METCPLLDVRSWSKIDPLVDWLARGELGDRERCASNDIIIAYFIVVIHSDLEIVTAESERDLEGLIPLWIERFFDIPRLVLLLNIQPQTEHHVRVGLAESVHFRNVVRFNRAHVNDHLAMK